MPNQTTINTLTDNLINDTMAELTGLDSRTIRKYDGLFLNEDNVETDAEQETAQYSVNCLVSTIPDSVIETVGYGGTVPAYWHPAL